MPIHEYVCNRCQTPFELLTSGSGAEPECSMCGSRDVRKLLSVFSSPEAGKHASIGCLGCETDMENASCYQKAGCGT